MAVTTVAQFAAQLNRPAATLLEQLQSAGVAKRSPDDVLTEGDKERLLEFLRSAHGTGERKKIVLTRKSTSEIKQADASGRARTIQVEVRKKRTFVKREDVGGTAEPSAPLPDEQEQARHEAEAEAVAEAQAALCQREMEEAAERERQAQVQRELEAAEAAQAAAEAARRAAQEEAARAEAAALAERERLASKPQPSEKPAAE